jgi:hypothetical protein
MDVQSHRRTIVALSLTSLLAVVGCQKDDIQAYEVPKQKLVRWADAGRADGPKTRMLAVIVPRGANTWFFKFEGPEQEMAAHKDEFDALLQSIHFADGNPPLTWKVPEGWRTDAGVPSRYATLRVGQGDKSLEFSATLLPTSPILANVNRWRGQLNLKEVSEAELGQCTKDVKVDGIASTYADLTGTKGAGGKRPPFAGKLPPQTPSKPQDGGQATVKYAAPSDWQELPPNSVAFAAAAFRVGSGDQAVEITVTSLGASAGGLQSNIDRWRGQVGLGPASAEDRRRDLREITVAGIKAPYVDLAGPESAEASRKRILGAIVVRGDQAWYFKARGPYWLVERQKAAFETFLGSVRFEGGNDG